MCLLVASSELSKLVLMMIAQLLNYGLAEVQRKKLRKEASKRCMGFLLFVYSCKERVLSSSYISVFT